MQPRPGRRRWQSVIGAQAVAARRGFDLGGCGLPGRRAAGHTYLAHLRALPGQACT